MSAPHLKYYNQTKLKFSAIYHTIGFLSAGLMLVVFSFNGSPHPAINPLTIGVLPVFTAALFSISRNRVRATALFTFLSIVFACGAAMFFNMTVFVTFISIFFFSTRMLSFNRIQFLATIGLLALTVTMKMLTESGLIQTDIFPVSGLSTTDLLLVIVFLFSIVSYSTFLSVVIDRGTRSTEQLLDTEVKLAERSRRAEQANQTKSMFLARMNHELRSPLQTALSASEMIEYDRDAVPILQAALNQTLVIIEDILDFSRLSAEGISLEHKKFGLIDGISELVTVYQSRAAKGVVVESHIAPDVPAHFYGDATRTFDIFRNLLSNAVKYTTEGSVILELKWDDSHYRRLNCSVRDSGTGIPPESLEAIFEPFVQVKRKSHARHGIGLGLHLARLAIESMGGKITARNLEGGGTSFDFYIDIEPCPRWRSHPRPAEQGHHCSECAGFENAESGRRRYNIDYSQPVLIVEDKEEIARNLKILLTGAGFLDVTIALNGTEALAAIKDRQPGMIILDLNLPDINGLDVAARMNQTTRAKTIVLTGDATSEVFARCRRAGLPHVLSKPARLDHILEAAAETLPGTAGAS